jgi:hypothetical protein
VSSEQSAAQLRAIHFRRRALLVYGAFALALIPWTAYLSSTLPARHESVHWDTLWAGFDIGLALAAAITALAVLRGLRLLPIAASVTGTLLLCDAWFDLWTSAPGSERTWAVGEALLGELPLAIFSFWVAHDARVLEHIAWNRVRRGRR